MKTFDNLFLIGRPAAGKSEFTDFMKKLPDAERAVNFHIGKFVELDDFVWLWEKFMEDNLWEESGAQRLYSHREGNNYGLNPEAASLFDLLVVKFNRAYKDKYRQNSPFYSDGTLFIEFSRGGDSGFSRAFDRLSKEIFERAAILYIDVSFDESWRRNIARYEEKLKHSILAHMVTRKAMETFYKTNDWANITGGKPFGLIPIHGTKVPFVTMGNEPESTDPKVLAPRYGNALNKLWEIYESKI